MNFSTKMVKVPLTVLAWIVPICLALQWYKTYMPDMWTSTEEVTSTILRSDDGPNSVRTTKIEPPKKYAFSALPGQEVTIPTGGGELRGNWGDNGCIAVTLVTTHNNGTRIIKAPVGKTQYLLHGGNFSTTKSQYAKASEIKFKILSCGRCLEQRPINFIIWFKPKV